MISNLNNAAITKLNKVGITNLTKSNTINTAPISGKESCSLTNQGIDKKVKPTNSTNPIPLGKKGVLSKTEIITNNTSKGTKSIETLTERKLKLKAKNSKK